MVQIADNFNYSGPKPNFTRDSYDTLEEMRRVSKAVMDDGHISWCREDNKHYTFNSNNPIDPITGQFRELTPVDNQLIESSSNPVSNQVINKELSNLNSKIDKLNDSIQEEIESNKNILINEYYLSWRDKDDISDSLENVIGNKDIADQWEPYLVEINDKIDKPKILGKLRRNNFLRYESGEFAPTVGISSSTYAECQGVLYLDKECKNLYCKAGEYDPLKFYSTFGHHGKIFNSHGTSIHPVMPWETDNKNLTIGIGFLNSIYIIDDVVGSSGKIWKGILGKSVFLDGIDSSKYRLNPCLISPCPVCTVDGKARNFFYTTAGESGCKSSRGKNGISSLFRDNRTYPRTGLSIEENQRITRSNNRDPQLSYPYAEGGWNTINAFITSQELLFKTLNLSQEDLFTSGTSSNVLCHDESSWKAFGGIRWINENGSEGWKYNCWCDNPDDLFIDSLGNSANFDDLLNLGNAKEQCMESQMAFSWAMEQNIPENQEFRFYSNDYWYRLVGNRKNNMDAIIYKKIIGKISAFDEQGILCKYLVEVILRFPLVSGVKMSGDIGTIWSGGMNIEKDGQKISIYSELDQKKWNEEFRNVMSTETTSPGWTKRRYSNTPIPIDFLDISELGYGAWTGNEECLTFGGSSREITSGIRSTTIELNNKSNVGGSMQILLQND